jgi:hypothetical protein
MTDSMKAGGQPVESNYAVILCNNIVRSQMPLVDAIICAPGRTRTFNQRIKSPLLYQLSHGGI